MVRHDNTCSCYDCRMSMRVSKKTGKKIGRVVADYLIETFEKREGSHD
jgi:hypothetical protein